MSADEQSANAPHWPRIRITRLWDLLNQAKDWNELCGWFINNIGSERCQMFWKVPSGYVVRLGSPRIYFGGYGPTASTAPPLPPDWSPLPSVKFVRLAPMIAGKVAQQAYLTASFVKPAILADRFPGGLSVPADPSDPSGSLEVLPHYAELHIQVLSPTTSNAWEMMDIDVTGVYIDDAVYQEIRSQLKHASDDQKPTGSTTESPRQPEVREITLPASGDKDAIKGATEKAPSIATEEVAVPETTDNGALGAVSKAAATADEAQEPTEDRAQTSVVDDAQASVERNTQVSTTDSTQAPAEETTQGPASEEAQAAATDDANTSDAGDAQEPATDDAKKADATDAQAPAADAPKQPDAGDSQPPAADAPKQPDAGDAQAPAKDDARQEAAIESNDSYRLKGVADAVYALYVAAKLCSEDDKYNRSKAEARREIASNKLLDISCGIRGLDAVFKKTRLHGAALLIDPNRDPKQGLSKAAKAKRVWPTKAARKLLDQNDPRRQPFMSESLVLIVHAAEQWRAWGATPPRGVSLVQALEGWLQEYGITGRGELATIFPIVTWNGQSFQPPPKSDAQLTDRGQTPGGRRASRP